MLALKKTMNSYDDLDWQAFAYAAGELSAAEAEAFESRLCDEQPAREALARAVELTQIVAAAESQAEICVTPATRAAFDWNRRLSWMAVGGVAALLLAMLWSGVVGPTWHSAQRRMGATANYQLAMAWNETHREMTGIREAALWVGDADDDSSSVNADAEAIADAPTWMTAAVFSVPRDSDETRTPRLDTQP
jgi:hypothetical protein